MRRIRALEIISGFAVEGPLGGIERFGLELAQAMDQTCVSPLVCGLWEYGTPSERSWMEVLELNGVDAFVAADWVGHSPYRSFWRALQEVREHITGRVDIIHSHCQFGDLISLLLRKRLGAQAVVRTVHNEQEWVKRPWRRLLLTHLAYPCAFDAEIGVARRVVDNLDSRPMARLLRRRAILMHNGVNVSRLDNVRLDRRGKLSGLGLPEDAFVVGTVGRLAPEKGHAVLLDAAALVLRRFPQVRFLIVGSGQLEHQLKRHAQRLSIEQQLTFTGPRQDVEELLGVMDLYVSSSIREALPMALLEAMAAALPIVATRASGNVELIEDGITGCLVPASSPECLADAISLLVADPSRAAAMGERARSCATDVFSIEEVARLHADLYTRLL